MKGQHSERWSVYCALSKKDKANFVDENFSVAHQNMIKILFGETQAPLHKFHNQHTV